MLVPASSYANLPFGFYLDYERFLYFLALPAIVCVGLIIVSLPNAVSQTSQFLQKRYKLTIRLPHLHITKKSATYLLISGMVFAVLFAPLFALPNVAITQTNYFQVMNPSEYQAIQWVKANTPSGSVCVADAEFGWWLGGFAEKHFERCFSTVFAFKSRSCACRSCCQSFVCRLFN